MKIKTLVKATLAASMLLSASAFAANNMYLDLGDNTYDNDRVLGTPDADTTTGIFTEFGFSQMLATSVYDLNEASEGPNPVFGSFYDTNITSELTAAGVPASGTAMDGSTPVNLTMPLDPAQIDLDALSPLVPPLGSDNEGFLQTWELVTEYHFDGTLSASGPVYTGGTFDVFFVDHTALANNRRVLGGTLTGSQLQAANLNLFFDITFAEDNFLWIENSNGIFVDANDGTISGNYAKMVLDTNVNPPIPTASQLLQIGTNAIRQTTLDGSVTARIPEPGTLALLGLGLLGFGVARRKQA